MILKKRIPKDFYKLFRTQNMDYYMTFLVAVYEENSEVYAALGLTQEDCRAIIEETISNRQIVWAKDMEEEEAEEDSLFTGGSSSAILGRLVRWGWLKSDFDEKLNDYVISFPEYSQLFVELFQKLLCEDDSRERESILSIYSALFTYHSDQEKNNEILKGALRTSRSLGQLLSNMQDGMRTYFEELSARKNFIGIQEVLIEEINNSDSKKYAILTTTDSFYRYKEAVKELISQILNESDAKKVELEQRQAGLDPASVLYAQNKRVAAFCEDTIQLVLKIEREFDLIEKKYNKLIEQKAVFAQRALARIHYILQEGTDEENQIVTLINLLDRSAKKEEILEELRKKMKFTAPYSIISDSSFYNRRERNDHEFTPLAVKDARCVLDQDLTDFVPKPLYTRQELWNFKKKNMQDGTFIATEETVSAVEDLEKLLFLWQEATESRQGRDHVMLGEELRSASGLVFSQLKIMEDENA